MARYILALLILVSVCDRASAQFYYQLDWYHHDELSDGTYGGFFFNYTGIQIGMDYAQEVLRTDDDGAATDDNACDVYLQMPYAVECFWTYSGGDADINNEPEMMRCFAALDRSCVALYMHYEFALGMATGFFDRQMDNPWKMAWFVGNTPISGTTIAHEIGHGCYLQHEASPVNVMVSPALAEGIFLGSVHDRRYVNRIQKLSYETGGGVIPYPTLAPSLPVNGGGVEGGPFEG